MRRPGGSLCLIFESEAPLYRTSVRRVYRLVVSAVFDRRTSREHFQGDVTRRSAHRPPIFRGFILFSDQCSNFLKKKFFDDQCLSYNSILWCFDGKRNSKISIDFSRDFQKIVRILPSRNWLDGIIIDRRPFFPSKTSHRERKTRSITLRFDLYPSSI